MVYDKANLFLETKNLNRARFFDLEAALNKFRNQELAHIQPVENRVAFYQDRMMHDTIGIIGRKTATSFFASHGITFDYWTRMGYIQLCDEGLNGSTAPLVTIQRDRHSCMEKFLNTLNITYSLLTSKKDDASHTYFPITKRVLYEYLSEKSKIDETLNFTQLVSQLDKDETFEIFNLISQFCQISTNRLLSPMDDDSIPKFQISSETVKLLAEGIQSNFAAEFDPTFHKPTLLPPYNRQIKKRLSFTESSDSISTIKRNSVDATSTSSTNISKKLPLMPTLNENNPELI